MDIAALICTECNIEKQSILLVRSIRRFGGTLSGLPIFVFSPRAGYRPSSWALKQLEAFDVVYVDALLNRDYPANGLANKPFICEYAERSIEANILVFLDSDKVVLNEPTLLNLSGRSIATIRPVYRKNIGVRHLTGGQNENYWRFLYQICGVRTQSEYVTSFVDNQRILQYFNSGLVSVRRGECVFIEWALNFRKIMNSGIFPTEPFFIEQSTLSATLSKRAREIDILPFSYNYPICLLDALPRQHQLGISETVSIHYHRALNNGKWRYFWDKSACVDASSDQYRWLVDNLVNLAF